MPLPALPLIDGCLFVDNSGWIEGFNTCYRYLEYKSLWLRIPSAEKPALNFGSAEHLGLEYRYSIYRNESVDDAYYNAVAGIFTEFFNEHPVPAEDWRTLNWAMTVLKKYNIKYDIEAFSLLKYDEPVTCPHCHGGEMGVGEVWEDASMQATVPCVWCRGTGKREMMVEIPFALPLYTHHDLEIIDAETGKVTNEVVVMFTGRIDLPVMIDGQIFVMDHKTTKQIGKQHWDKMRMSSQQKGYVWAFTEIAKRQVAGYIVNTIRTSAPPQYVLEGKPSRTGEKKSPEAWWDESLQRERFILKPSDLEEWRNNTIDLCEEFFWHYTRGYMPMKTEWCSSYGQCPYYNICRVDASDRPMLLQSGEFADNTWSPLHQPSQIKQ